MIHRHLNFQADLMINLTSASKRPQKYVIMPVLPGFSEKFTFLKRLPDNHKDTKTLRNTKSL